MTGYKKYLQSLTRPYKYADLLATIEAIIAEDIFNQTYGKQRMYEKLQIKHRVVIAEQQPVMAMG